MVEPSTSASILPNQANRASKRLVLNRHPTEDGAMIRTFL